MSHGSRSFPSLSHHFPIMFPSFFPLLFHHVPRIFPHVLIMLPSFARRFPPITFPITLPIMFPSLSHCPIIFPWFPLHKCPLLLLFTMGPHLATTWRPKRRHPRHHHRKVTRHESSFKAHGNGHLTKWHGIYYVYIGSISITMYVYIHMYIYILYIYNTFIYEPGPWSATPPNGMVPPHSTSQTFHLHAICSIWEPQPPHWTLSDCKCLTYQSSTYYPKHVYVLPIAYLTHGLQLIVCLYAT